MFFPRGTRKSRQLFGRAHSDNAIRRKRLVLWRARRLGQLRRMRIVASIALLCGPLALWAQQSPATTNDQNLPDAPGIEATVVAPDEGGNATAGSAAISGTVLDTNGSEVQDAHVVLKNLAGEQTRSEQSNSDGEFNFTGLSAGNFELVVSGQGWGTFVSPEIQLRRGDFHIVPNVVLPVTSSAVVRVIAGREQLAEEQVHIAEQQRVLKIFPNFYSSYDWNAPPMGTRQKFQLSLRSLTDPVTFLGVAATAGFEQQANLFPGYGSGAQGYAKRYGAAYANDFTGDFLADAIFPSVFHQDPRYFYRGRGSFGSRALYAISAAVMARSDSGRWEPNYSFILGSFSAGGISNLYYPAADRGAKLTLVNGLVDIGEHAGSNLVREFILKRFSSRAHDKGAGQD